MTHWRSLRDNPSGKTWKAADYTVVKMSICAQWYSVVSSSSSNSFRHQTETFSFQRTFGC